MDLNRSGAAWHQKITAELNSTTARMTYRLYTLE